MKIKAKPARNKQADSLPLVRHAINGIEEKKGSEIACLNLKKISNSPCDYFVICEGNSRTHVQAIAGSIEESIKKETGTRPWHVEGLQNAEWVLMDYVDVVVHVFQPHIRQHFGLENMWADADVKDMTEKKRAGNSSRKKKSSPKKKVSAKKKIPIKKNVSLKNTVKKTAKRKNK
jgi:ribosome-associated protein